MPDLDADVCVVGAGYAGLTTAVQVTEAGRSVIVLEARDRVGGRIWTQPTSGGTPVDRGGAWLGPRHDEMFALARKYGVETYKTWVKGAHLLIGAGRTRRYTGLIPKISPLAVLSIARNQRRVNRLAQQVPVDEPWNARRAAEWDAQTVADWLEHTGIRTQLARDLFEMAVRGLFTGDLADTSFLHLLWLVRAHGSIDTLFSIENGAQENMISGGAGSIARKMAESLGDAVRLTTPVRTITQRDDHVVVAGDSQIVRANHVVVTTPPALTLDITFDPVLPTDRLALYRASVAGPETKTLVVYSDAFWRDAGFSGQSAEPGSPAEVTIDASPADGKSGVLAVFSFGVVAERVAAMREDQRRQAIVDALTSRFGPNASAPSDVIETAWWSEEWTRGCSMAHLPPGILTRYGPLIRQPFGRVHWAGTETSTTSHGAMDGAVRSGRRAATEVLAAN